MEDGNGGERDEVLAKHNVETFLIMPPSIKTSSNSTKEVTKNLKLFRCSIFLLNSIDLSDDKHFFIFIYFLDEAKQWNIGYSGKWRSQRLNL